MNKYFLRGIPAPREGFFFESPSRHFPASQKGVEIIYLSLFFK